jgi:hypothetical protein
MRTQMKECFGTQGMDALHGDSVEKCIDCELFDKCNKITIAITLQAMTTDIELIVQNGLTDGRLRSFNELEKESENE